MSLFKTTVAALERRFPTVLASRSWDNVGILLEAPHERVEADRVLLTIDLTTAVYHEAASDPRIGAIVAYHPPIFRGLKQLTLADPKQAILLNCAARGISVYSPHTAWDNQAAIGNADWLAGNLGSLVAKTETIDPIQGAAQPCDDGHVHGTGRLVTLSQPEALSTLVANLKANLGLQYVRVAKAIKYHENGSDHEGIRTVAICAGSGASVLTKSKADLFLTGEMSHHEVLAAIEDQTSVILCEHTNTERGFLSQVIKPYLLDEFKKAGAAYDVRCSQVDRDPLEQA